jgi:hypothetical protein
MRAPFAAVRSFAGIYARDPAISCIVVRALALAAEFSNEAAAAWILCDDHAVGGGWSKLAVEAFNALKSRRTGKEMIS